MSEWHCYVDGKQYGPVSDADLRAWIQQGRVKPTDNVWREGMADWIPAGSVPELLSPGAVVPATGFQPPPPTGPGMGLPGAGYVRPHRGTAVLVLGILGLAVCPICGIIAWAMGSKDMREMRAGCMDRSGEGMTRAGYICGMISVIVALVGLVIWVVAFVAMAPF